MDNLQKPETCCKADAMPDSHSLDARSRALRRVILDALYHGGRGHLPSAFSCIEVLRVLYDSILRFRPDDPDWPDRDRLILSKGHGCLALYAMLADKRFFSAKDLDCFCRLDSHLGGHPERGCTPGVEASTGSLGHGPSLGVGMALAARIDRRPTRVFVLCGDGETNEGSVWEACLSAAKHGLEKFVLLIDYNKQQSWDDVPSIMPLEPYADKFRAFGFAVAEADGHDVAGLESVLRNLPLQSGRPSAVICHTVKGKGLPSLERNLKWHHKTALPEEQYLALAAELEARA